MKKITWFLALFLFTFSYLWLFRAFSLNIYPDFTVYYNATRVTFENLNPYDVGRLFFTGYSYPPSVLLLFIPFYFLPIEIGSHIWLVINLLLVMASCYYLSKIFSLSFFSRLNLFLSSLIFISFPVKFTLGMGQINIVVLFLMVMGIYLMKKNKDVSCGFLLGLCLLIKLFPLLLPFYFLRAKKVRILLSMAGSFVVAAILVMLFIPENVWMYFLQKVLPDYLTSSWKLDYYSQSLSAFVGRTFGTGQLGNILKLVLTVICLASVAVVLLKKRKKDFYTEVLLIGFIIVATMLINTFSWQHHFVWLAIPMYAGVCYIKMQKSFSNSKKSILFSIFGIAYILVAANLKDPNMFPVIFQSHIFYGAVVVYFVTFYILLKSSK